MSENETAAEDKTEEPSQRRLDEARRDGKIPVSKDVVSGVAVVAGAMAVIKNVDDIVRGGTNAVVAIIGRMGDVDAQTPLSDAVFAACMPLWHPGLRVVGIIAAVALVVTIAQTRGGVWANQAAPDIEKAFSPKRVIHAFSRQGAADMGLAIVKALAIGLVSWDVARHSLPTLHQALTASSGTTTAALGATLGAVAQRSALVLGTAGLIDLFLVRRRSMIDMRMTKEEIKREAKEDEGDPHIRAARRRRHRDLKRGSIHKEVPRADAIVVNPTHIAVAIRYRKSADPARLVRKDREQLVHGPIDLLEIRSGRGRKGPDPATLQGAGRDEPRTAMGNHAGPRSAHPVAGQDRRSGRGG